MHAHCNIKGTGMIGLVRALRSQREQALSLLPAELHDYLDKRIAITAWYPESHYFAIASVYMQLHRDESWETAGAYAAQQALTTVYKNIVVDGDLAETAARMRVNWRNYHDTGELTTECEAGCVRVKVRDYGIVKQELCRLNMGYFATLLGMSGVAITSRSKPKCKARGDAQCVWEFGWSPK
jgi:hypothetical protein